MYAKKEKEKKKEKKLQNFSPNSVVGAEPEGGACTLIRRRPVRRGADWRAGPAERGVGEGSGPPRPRERLAPGAG